MFILKLFRQIERESECERTTKDFITVQIWDSVGCWYCEDWYPAQYWQINSYPHRSRKVIQYCGWGLDEGFCGFSGLQFCAG